MNIPCEENIFKWFLLPIYKKLFSLDSIDNTAENFYDSCTYPLEYV